MGVKLSGDWNLLEDVSGRLLGRDQMQAIGDFALAIVKARVARGIGSDDTPMPALKTVGEGRNGKPRQIRYVQQKSRQGLQPIRDLRGTGPGPHMLDAFQVVSIADDSVRIAFTTPDANKKAAINERRAAFIGWSDGDAREVAEFARELFRAQVQEILGDWKRQKRGI